MHRARATVWIAALLTVLLAVGFFFSAVLAAVTLSPDAITAANQFAAAYEVVLPVVLLAALLLLAVWSPPKPPRVWPILLALPVAILAMAATGYALYLPGQFAWLYNSVGYFTIRGVHLVLFYYFVATLIAHAYLAFIPMNWGKLGSMVRGRGKVPEHRGASPPTPGPSRASSTEAASEPSQQGR